MDLFFAWLREPNPEYHVEYAKDFGIVDVAQEIQTAQAVKDLDLVPGMLKQILIKVMGAYLPELAADDFDDLLAKVEEQIRSSDYGLPLLKDEDDESEEPNQTVLK